LETDSRPFRGKIVLKIDTNIFWTKVDMLQKNRKKVWIFPILNEKNGSISLYPLKKNSPKKEPEKSDLALSWTQRLEKIMTNLKGLEGWDFWKARWGKKKNQNLDLKMLPPMGIYLEALDLIIVDEKPTPQEKKVLLEWCALGGILVDSNHFLLPLPQKRKKVKEKKNYGKGWIYFRLPTEEEEERIPFALGRSCPVADPLAIKTMAQLFPPTMEQHLWIVFLFSYFGIFYILFYKQKWEMKQIVVFLGVFSIFGYWLSTQRDLALTFTIIQTKANQNIIAGESYLTMNTYGLPHSVEIRSVQGLPLRPLVFASHDFQSFSLGPTSLQNLPLHPITPFCIRYTL
ncbi:MAG: hypothetical protein D6785_01635, partial [Planctomycetota bacterium]